MGPEKVKSDNTNCYTILEILLVTVVILTQMILFLESIIVVTYVYMPWFSLRPRGDYFKMSFRTVRVVPRVVETNQFHNIIGFSSKTYLISVECEINQPLIKTKMASNIYGYVKDSADHLILVILVISLPYNDILVYLLLP